MGDTDKPSRSERVITLTNIYVAVGDGEKKKREKENVTYHPSEAYFYSWAPENQPLNCRLTLVTTPHRLFSTLTHRGG